MTKAGPSVGERYVAWLKKHGYRDVTIVKLLRDIRTVAKHGEPPLSRNHPRRISEYNWTWSRWDLFCKDEGLTNNIPAPPPRPEKIGPSRFKQKRQQPAIAFSETEWVVLLKAIRDDESIEARVIEVLCSTGLRVGDVLRINRRQLDAGFAHPEGRFEMVLKGGKKTIDTVQKARFAWRHLQARLKPDQFVCDAISAGSGWTTADNAYTRVLRCFKRLGVATNMSGRLHLHRLRRSVGTLLKKRGVPLHIIQQIYGHERVQTTQGYVDEPMPEIGIDALRSIQGDAEGEDGTD